MLKLFGEKDPLALVKRGRLLPEGDRQYNLDLAESRKAIEARRSEQRKFPRAYAARTSSVVDKVNITEAAKQQRQMEKLREEVSSLKAQQKVLSRKVDNSRGDKRQQRGSAGQERSRA